MDSFHLQRFLKPPERSFFLFGPRGVGKSTWLKENFPGAVWLDLLRGSLFLDLAAHPDRLAALAGPHPAGSWVVVDEAQKLPSLLDEVHHLIEEKRWRFALCGSSARKLRRGGVNLLGGRAVTRSLGPFSAAELGDRFDLDFALQWGMLPAVWQGPKDAADLLDAYVHTYLHSEIAEEGLVRRLPPFARFLTVAGLLNGQVVNAQNVARESSIPRSTVDQYFSILEDTLLGSFLPPYQPRLRLREPAHKKFYWFDPGVARAAAGLLRDPLDRSWSGFALETLVLHELGTYNAASEKHRGLFYYPSGVDREIDFLIETRKSVSGRPPHVIGVEVKLSPRWDRGWEGPLRRLAAAPKIRVERMIGVYTGDRTWRFDDFDVYPVTEFFKRLHDGLVY